MSRYDDEFKFVGEDRKIYRISTWDDDTEDAPWDETTYRVENYNMVDGNRVIKRIPTGELFTLSQEDVGDDLDLASLNFLDVVALRKGVPLAPWRRCDDKGEIVGTAIIPADSPLPAEEAKIPLNVTRRQYRLLVAGLVCLMENLMDWTTIQQLYESEGVADPQPQKHVKGRNDLMADAQKLKSTLYQAAKFFQ